VRCARAMRGRVKQREGTGGRESGVLGCAMWGWGGRIGGTVEEGGGVKEMVLGLRGGLAEGVYRRGRGGSDVSLGSKGQGGCRREGWEGHGRTQK